MMKGGWRQQTEGRGRMTEKNRISNIEYPPQGVLWRTPTDSIGTGKEYRMTKCGGRISGEQEIRVQVIRTVGYQAVKEKIEDRERKIDDRISEFEIRDLEI